MKAILSCCVTLLLSLGAASAQAGGRFHPPGGTLEPFVLLDNFSGDHIDKTIWNGTRRPDTDVLDFAREVRHGRLHLKNRSYNDTSFPGGFNSTAVRLFLNNSDPVTAMRAWFRVNAVDVSGCEDSSAASEIRVRHAGYFFKSGGIGDPFIGNPFSATGDVFVELRIRRLSDSPDPPGVLQIRAVVFLCTDQFCDNGFNVFDEREAFGRTRVGRWTRLTIWWDPDNDRFLFQRDFRPPIKFVYTTGVFPLDDGGDPPNLPASGLNFVHKRLEARGFIENCVTGPEATGSIDAFIDRYQVNQSAVLP